MNRHQRRALKAIKRKALKKNAKQVQHQQSLISKDLGLNQLDESIWKKTVRKKGLFGIEKEGSLVGLI